MAVEGIANLVQNLADQLFGQEREKQAGTITLGTGRTGNPEASEDTFTPSRQNNSAHATAQETGIFQVRQVALTEVTANILIGQTTPNANQNGAPAQAASGATTNAGTAQADAATNTHSAANAAQQGAASPGAPAAAGAAAATTKVQDQIQALNAALPALGLSYAEIQQIDRIASLIQVFNPAAFTDLVNQFEALAKQAAQQIAANAAGRTTATTNAGTSANGGGFQVQEIFIHFTGLQETGNSAAASGGQGAAANNFQITASSLQIEQVQFTLANGNGEAVHVQTPQQSTNEETKDRPASQTHLATA